MITKIYKFQTESIMYNKDLECQNMHLVTWLLIIPHHSEPFWVEILVKDNEKMVPWTDIMKFIDSYLIKKCMRNASNTKRTKRR